MQNLNPNMDNTPDNPAGASKASDVGEQAMDNISEKAKQALRTPGSQTTDNSTEQAAKNLGSLGNQIGHAANTLGSLSGQVRRATTPDNLSNLSSQVRSSADQLGWISDQVRKVSVDLSNLATPVTSSSESADKEMSQQDSGAANKPAAGGMDDTEASSVRRLSFQSGQAADILAGPTKQAAGNPEVQVRNPDTKDGNQIGSTMSSSDNTGQPAKQAASDISQKVADTTGKASDQTTQTAEGSTAQASSGLSDRTKEALAGGAGIVGAAGAAFKGFWSSDSDQIHQTTEDVAAQASHTTEQHSTNEQTMQPPNFQAGQTSSSINQAGDQAKQATSSASGQMSGVMGKEDQAKQMADQAGDQASKVADKLSDAGGQAKQAAGKVGDQISGAIENTGEQTKQMAGDFHNQAKQAAGEIGDQAKEKLGGIGGFFKGLWGGASETEGSQPTQAAGSAGERAGDMGSRTQQMAGDTGGQTMQPLSSQRDQPGSTLDQLADPAKQTASGVSDQSSQTAIQMGEQTAGVVGAGALGAGVAHRLGKGDEPEEHQPAASAPASSSQAAQETATTVTLNASEWRTLIETPLKVEMAMVMASPSSAGGVMREMLIVWKEAHNLMSGTGQNPLLNAIGKQMKNLFEREPDSKHLPFTAFADIGDETRYEDSRLQALAACQETAQLLKKVPAQDAKAYKEYVYTAAQDVAEATRGRGFMGRMGDQVSYEEAALLNEVAGALGFR